MNMKKTFGVKKLIVLIFSLALVVLLAACGGTGSPANGGMDIPAEPAPSHPDNIGYITVGDQTIDIRVLASAGLTEEQKFAPVTGLMARLEAALSTPGFELLDAFSQLRIIEVYGLATMSDISRRANGILYGHFSYFGGLSSIIGAALFAGFPPVAYNSAQTQFTMLANQRG